MFKREEALGKQQSQVMFVIASMQPIPKRII